MDCKFCKDPRPAGIGLKGGERNFTYLADGESAHLECYIEHCVKMAFDKQLERKMCEPWAAEMADSVLTQHPSMKEGD